MSEARDRPSREDLEAQRELLREAIADLPSASNPHQAAHEVLRALDTYIENSHRSAVEPRESPVADFGRRPEGGVRWARWVVLAGALLATLVVAVVISGGWVAGVIIIGVWALALLALATT